MAHIIPNEQHSERVLYQTALNNFREKQFTGSPGKVQLTAAHKTFTRRPRRLNSLTLRTASCTMNRNGRLAQLVRAPALQAGGRRFEPCTAHHSRLAQAPQASSIHCDAPEFSWLERCPLSRHVSQYEAISNFYTTLFTLLLVLDSFCFSFSPVSGRWQVMGPLEESCAFFERRPIVFDHAH
jgi:hypothetical protein